MLDDPLFSPRRLYNAWRSWLWLSRIGASKYTLRYKLRYYRRPYAEFLREEK